MHLLILNISAFEGDAGIIDDKLKFGMDKGNLTSLSGPDNNANSFFAPHINNGDGILNTTGSCGPNNTRSNSDDIVTRRRLDITAVDVSSLLRNNQSTTFIQAASSGDNYIINALGLQLDVDTPLIRRQITTDKLLTDIGE